MERFFIDLKLQLLHHSFFRYSGYFIRLYNSSSLGDNTISILRLRLRASDVDPWSIGWNSPFPVAVIRLFSIFCISVRYRTTEVARNTLRSQLSFICPRLTTL